MRSWVATVVIVLCRELAAISSPCSIPQNPAGAPSCLYQPLNTSCLIRSPAVGSPGWARIGRAGVAGPAPAPAPGPVGSTLDLDAVTASCGPDFRVSLTTNGDKPGSNPDYPYNIFVQAVKTVKAADPEALTLDIPSDGRLLLAIPSDEAVKAALAAENLDVKQIQDDPELAKLIVWQHVLFTQSDNAQALPALEDAVGAAPVWLCAKGGPEPGMTAEEFFASDPADLELTFGVKEIPVEKIRSCDNVDVTFIARALSPTPEPPRAEPDGIIIAEGVDDPGFARTVRGAAVGIFLMDSLTAPDASLAPLQADGSFKATVGDVATVVRSSCGTAGSRDLALSSKFLEAIRAVKDEPVNILIGSDMEAAIVVPSDAALERYALEQGTTIDALLADKTKVMEIIDAHALAVKTDSNEADCLIFADDDIAGISSWGLFGTKNGDSASFQEFMNDTGNATRLIFADDGNTEIPVRATYQCSNGVNLVMADGFIIRE